MLRWLFGWWAWECVYFSSSLEVERNNATAQYRHRSVHYGGQWTIEGPWIPGLPGPEFPAVRLDDFLTAEEMAHRLASMRRR